jgi:hypothetical protein
LRFFKALFRVYSSFRCYNNSNIPFEKGIDAMKTWRLPTNIIVNEIMWVRPAVRHLLGKYFWDGDYKVLLIGDKTMKQHKAKYYKLND